jgi:integrase/recombinase XerD
MEKPLTTRILLNHESVQTTQIYLYADMTMKERALALTAPMGTKQSRYRPSDELLAFLAGR